MPSASLGAGTTPESGSTADGFLTHIRQLGRSVLLHIAMRVELLSIEVQEEKARLIRLLISAALVAAMLIVSLVMLAILILALTWDTPHRVAAACWLLAAFIGLAVAGSMSLVTQLKRSTMLFAASAKELRRDAANLATAA